MEKTVILKRMEELAEKLSIDLRYDVYQKDCGFGKYRQKYYAVIHKYLPTDAKIACLGEMLKGFDLENLYVLPEIRRAIFGKDE